MSDFPPRPPVVRLLGHLRRLPSFPCLPISLSTHSVGMALMATPAIAALPLLGARLTRPPCYDIPSGPPLWPPWATASEAYATVHDPRGLLDHFNPPSTREGMAPHAGNLLITIVKALSSTLGDTIAAARHAGESLQSPRLALPRT